MVQVPSRICWGSLEMQQIRTFLLLRKAIRCVFDNKTGHEKSLFIPTSHSCHRPELGAQQPFDFIISIGHHPYSLSLSLVTSDED